MSEVRTRHPLVELTLARMREFLREPEALFWAFVFPLVMSAAIAVAFPRSSAKPFAVAIGPGAEAAAMHRILDGTPGVLVRDIPTSRQEAAIREGEIDLVLIPTMPPTYRYDPVRDESRLARLVVDEALQRAAGRRDPWTAREQALQIPGSRYVDWLIPGIIGMGIMSNGMWSVSFAIVQARMRKLLKRLIASPMRRRDYLAAQLISRMMFLLPEVGFPLIFGTLVLGLPIRGSYVDIAVVAIVGAMAFGGIGLLAASRARTFEGISAILNLTMLPMWVLSGVFFSATRFPAVLQPVIKALPLTILNDALRAAILDGASLSALAGHLSLLMAWAVVPFLLALRWFRWR